MVLEVIPFNRPGSIERFFLILLQEPEKAPVKRSVRQSGKEQLTNGDKYALSLERELAEVKEYMRFTLQEQESTNSQLSFAIEGLQSSNEELQSLNEELETSKEELESGNEELNTLNDELRNRNVELTNLNIRLAEVSEMNEAILKTMREPFLILDNDLVVKSANSAFYRLLRPRNARQWIDTSMISAISTGTYPACEQLLQKY